MQDKNTYANGQKIQELKGNKMTYFYKNGKVKAVGKMKDKLMEGEWKFYRETGQLWVVGNFKGSKKNGSSIRYDRKDKLEYNEMFVDDKKVKK